MPLGGLLQLRIRPKPTAAWKRPRRGSAGRRCHYCQRQGVRPRAAAAASASARVRGTAPRAARRSCRPRVRVSATTRTGGPAPPGGGAAASQRAATSVPSVPAPRTSKSPMAAGAPEEAISAVVAPAAAAASTAGGALVTVIARCIACVVGKETREGNRRGHGRAVVARTPQRAVVARTPWCDSAASDCREHVLSERTTVASKGSGTRQYV